MPEGGPDLARRLDPRVVGLDGLASSGNVTERDGAGPVPGGHGTALEVTRGRCGSIEATCQGVSRNRSFGSAASSC